MRGSDRNHLITCIQADLSKCVWEYIGTHADRVRGTHDLHRGTHLITDQLGHFCCIYGCVVLENLRLAERLTNYPYDWHGTCSTTWFIPFCWLAVCAMAALARDRFFCGMQDPSIFFGGGRVFLALDHVEGFLCNFCWKYYASYIVTSFYRCHL